VPVGCVVECGCVCGGGEVLLGESVSYYGKSEDRDVVEDLITVCEN
jgi:hypothetical protein